MAKDTGVGTTKAAATTGANGAAAPKKDRSAFTEVKLDSFLWRGSSGLTDLIGRIVAIGEMDTKHKSPENPTGAMEFVLLIATEEASWKNEDGTVETCTIGSEVKVPISAGLNGLLDKAKEVLRGDAAPEVVLRFTGKTKVTPKGTMKFYNMDLEPQADWPKLSVFAPQHVVHDFQVTQIGDGGPAPKQLGAAS